MRFAWLTGWATSPQATEEHAQAWHSAEHRVVLPGPDWRSDLAPLLNPDTVLCGYSTGAHLLLREPELWNQAGKVLLFAPFLHLRSDAELGGRADAAVLRRWLAALPTQRERTVATFRRWVGLPSDQEASFIPLDLLSWGLAQLLNGPPAQVPDQPFEAWLGRADPLIDGEALRAHIPSLHLVEGGHSLPELLRAAGRVSP